MTVYGCGCVGWPKCPHNAPSLDVSVPNEPSDRPARLLTPSEQKMFDGINEILNNGRSKPIQASQLMNLMYEEPSDSQDPVKIAEIRGKRLVLSEPSAIGDELAFKNELPEDEEWTAHINILNQWTEPDRYLRQIIQYARSGKFYPADMHVKLIEQVIEQQTKLALANYGRRNEQLEKILTPEVVANSVKAVSSMKVADKKHFAQRMKNEGYSLEQIQRTMGAKHKSNVQYWLSDEASIKERSEDERS